MGKVFTITEGLENMGAIRTGGQGSVYKGRRLGEIISAVKLLPTPIHTEDKKDKNYRDFSNEVEKLKKVNEVPNPNVVKILSSGLTESGSFPFIEMEFIEGPDLEELLKAPNDPIFSIHELVKLANQLSNALAHCHKVGVKHGDIKSNNVKFNAFTGNYVLLDFGLAIMSDEERRTSLRRAGAIEFMAPEQSEGQMLFESDVYSFGVILYELLAGRVPFPLNDKGETARNKVMLSHMEAPVPDPLELRRRHIPKTWSPEKAESEMRVPVWVLAIIKRCLEKESESRFKNGVELHEAVVKGFTADLGNSEVAVKRSSQLEKENNELRDRLLILEGREISQEPVAPVAYTDPDKISLSKPLFYGLLLLLFGLIAYTAYSFYNSEPTEDRVKSIYPVDSVSVDSTELNSDPEIKANDDLDKRIRSSIDSVERAEAKKQDTTTNEPVEPVVTEPEPEQNNEPVPVPTENEPEPSQRPPKYTLSVTKAYFHDSPNESSRREAFLVKWNNAELTALDDKNGFIYVVFFNIQGQVTKGWLRKRDLRRIS
ncbi:serine/threonine-protein kinase [Daejeonella lutea]|uniref:Serine/threonine protein kinase n=1 Tax=Daejeonella lutea TaxID=572036 RepID=A0A1T5AD14_9SPHI|nr:serine/threonine-protein kinase [Daejeonella lutea]SKB32785.1 serine/threonine protein kinase [Daejeonella lutea]